MTEKTLPNPESESQKPDKQVVILAGGVVDKGKFGEEVEKLMKEKAGQVEDIHENTHTNLINLRIQSYEKRDIPSTHIDDAFRKFLPQENTKSLSEVFTTDEVNDFTYEMLRVAEENLQGITQEDLNNIGNQSIINFQEILKFPTDREGKKKSYEEIMGDVQTFGRQFARTLKEKRKPQK